MQRAAAGVASGSGVILGQAAVLQPERRAGSLYLRAQQLRLQHGAVVIKRLWHHVQVEADAEQEVHLQIVKENQKLHKGSVEIEDDFATLADKTIFPGDFLWVRDSKIYENRDIAGRSVLPSNLLAVLAANNSRVRGHLFIIRGNLQQYMQDSDMPSGKRRHKHRRRRRHFSRCPLHYALSTPDIPLPPRRSLTPAANGG